MKNMPVTETEFMEKSMERCQAMLTCGMSVPTVARPIVTIAAEIASQEKTTLPTKRESVRSAVLQQSSFKLNA